MTTITTENQEEKVKEEIDFLLSHFEGRQRLFPRKMSTYASNGKQFTVYNKEQIVVECIKSNFVDCRLNAYPILEDGLLQAPNLIFIDLDLQPNLKELNKNLDKTLKTIKQKLNGLKPTVFWTGNGYHIYIVLDVRPLELIEELRELSNEPSEQFLRFAESLFTNNKKDFHHNPSFQSCLLRIPGTINSKNTSEVKIIQMFEANNIPSVDKQILREFRLYLADSDIKRKLKDFANEINKKKYYKNFDSQFITIPKCYRWIEDVLLKTPISDYRKRTIDFILAPYFINIKKLDKSEIKNIITNWLINCNVSRPLHPSIDYFDNKIKLAIDRSLSNNLLPIKIDSIKIKDSDWYNFLKSILQ